MATTLDNNKLIAEFMGLEIITDGISWFDTNYKALKNYNDSWEWLMSVIEKIESIGVSVNIKGHYNVFNKVVYNQTTINYTIYNTVTKTTASDEVVLFNYHSDTDKDKLKTTYQAVVKFIEWYNTQKV